METMQKLSYRFPVFPVFSLRPGEQKEEQVNVEKHTGLFKFYYFTADIIEKSTY